MNEVTYAEAHAEQKNVYLGGRYLTGALYRHIFTLSPVGSLCNIRLQNSAGSTEIQMEYGCNLGVSVQIIELWMTLHH